LVEEEYRLSYFGWDKMAVYRSLVLLLANRDGCWDPREALETVEQSKLRAFLDQMGYTEFSMPREVDPLLLTRERELAAEARGKILAMRQAKTDVQKQKLAAQIVRLQGQWADILNGMQEQAPEYVALRSATPLDYTRMGELLIV
jgi:hypothetical protein